MRAYACTIVDACNLVCTCASPAKLKHSSDSERMHASCMPTCVLGLGRLYEDHAGNILSGCDGRMQGRAHIQMDTIGTVCTNRCQYMTISSCV
eukprot:5369130-Pleurochrysis_carterae.AAC.1